MGRIKMPETLLSPSNLLLYGRQLEDLHFTFVDPSKPGKSDLPPPPLRLGANKFLEAQMASAYEDEQHRATLARIYGCSFKGHYYDLPEPVIVLVHGPGSDPDEPRPADTLPQSRMARAPADMDRTGVAMTSLSFSQDIRVWSYDKADLTLRLHVQTGSFGDVILRSLLGIHNPDGPSLGPLPGQSTTVLLMSLLLKYLQEQGVTVES
jgi:hypothetical protein